MLLRRALISMVVTFVLTVVIQVTWHFQRLNPGHGITITTRKGIGAEAFPQLREAALEIDRRPISDSERTYGSGTCAHEASTKICAHTFGLAGSSVDHLPISQTSSMRRFGAPISPRPQPSPCSSSSGAASASSDDHESVSVLDPEPLCCRSPGLRGESGHWFVRAKPRESAARRRATAPA
ncbi:hypothetical protein ACFVTC_18910 [Streptomyces sp. NPDC057950]|uniref:hypothetical protein n=1 Tax=Streptomyces sp. NPDC057950 TaxID=3346288 RepID=UPI0036E031DC